MPFLKSHLESSIVRRRTEAHEALCAKKGATVSIVLDFTPRITMPTFAITASLFAVGLSVHSGRSMVVDGISKFGSKGSGLGGRGGTSVMVPSCRCPLTSPRHLLGSASVSSFLFAAPVVPPSLLANEVVGGALPSRSKDVLAEVSCTIESAKATFA